MPFVVDLLSLLPTSAAEGILLPALRNDAAAAAGRQLEGSTWWASACDVCRREDILDCAVRELRFRTS